MPDTDVLASPEACRAEDPFEDGEARTDWRCTAVVSVALGVSPFSKTPNSLADAAGDGEGSLLGATRPLTFMLALRLVIVAELDVDPFSAGDVTVEVRL